VKTFAYIVFHRPHDKSGNPQNRMRVYRVMNNVPRQIGEEFEVGYMDAAQAAVAQCVHQGHLSKIHAGKTAARLNNDGIAYFYEL
jgi:hypothetical protein